MPGLIDVGILKPELGNSLAAGYQQAEQTRNLLAQQQQARQLNDIQLRNALRGEQEALAESEAAKGSTSLQDLALRQRQAGLAKQALATEAAISKQRADQLSMLKNTTELMKSAATGIMSEPTLDNALSSLKDFGSRTGTDVSRDIEALTKIGNNPKGIYNWAAGHAVSADKLLPQFKQISIPGVGVQTGTTDFSGNFTPNQLLKEQMSEYQIAQNKIAQRNADIAAGRLGVEQQRLKQDATGVVYQEDANGNIVALPSKLKAGEIPVGRTAVAPGGGFQPMMAKPSEAVGKEQMSINQQRAIVKGALNAIAQTPDAFGYTAGSMPESLRGRMASPEENTNRAYLFNVVSGVIKERAGTAQSAAEAQTLARFLPTETDSADIIKSKLQGFDNYLTDKETGTTKKRAGPTNSTLTQVDQQALQWANSNPADPRAAAIKQRLGM